MVLLSVTPCFFLHEAWHDTLSELLHASRVGVCHLIFCKVQLGYVVKSQTLDKGAQFLVLFKPLMFMHDYHVTTEGFRRLPPTPNLVWLLYFPVKVKLCNKWNLLYFLKDSAMRSVVWVCPLTVAYSYCMCHFKRVLRMFWCHLFWCCVVYFYRSPSSVPSGTGSKNWKTWLLSK